MSYTALVLIPADCTADLDGAEVRLGKRFPQMQIVRQANVIRLSDDWTMEVGFSDDPHVLEESREIVDEFGTDRIDASRLRTANRRFEISTDPDPEMERFNDFVLAVETLTSWDGTAAFDPQGCEFM